ncbi:MAG: type II toxin-antitoxin system VapC family toxin [Anaerolineae bacterium]|nr:type II toxin-antitoxin system VapC family toxin [Anaerolineae bacterium]
MNGNLLDTNAVIALQKSDSAILKVLTSDEDVFIPSIVVGELYYGTYNSLRVKDNLLVLKEFIENNAILNCDATTGDIYGQIRYQLKLKGRPIPENDIWIAAIAIQHDLTLITRDEHFKMVENLSLQIW